MTNSDRTLEPETKKNSFTLEDTVAADPSADGESADTYMRGVGRILYDIIWEWHQQRRNEVPNKPNPAESGQINALEGRSA